MKKIGIPVPGMKFDKTGKRLVSDESRFDVSKQLKRRPGGSKRTRVARRGEQLDIEDCIRRSYSKRP